MDNAAIFKLSYGLFVLSAKDGDKDNGCIVNTVQQVTVTPNRLTVAVNKGNFTCEMIQKTGEFNVSILSTDAPFDIFTRFGFQSGRDVDKFDGFETYDRTDNGIAYLTQYANAVISGKVVDTYDLGTHILFIADVTDAKVLSDKDSVTYDFYHKNIKPAPQKTEKKGWRCKICGYIYEGEDLPADFICPICKHGAADFEPI